MADSDNKALKASTELEKHQALMNKLEQEFSRFKRDDAVKTIQEIERQKKAITDLYDKSQISVVHYNQAISKSDRIIKTATKAATWSTENAWMKTSSKIGGVLSDISRAAGVNFETLSEVGAVLWIAKLADSQRTLKNWAATNVLITGESSKKSAQTFADEYASAGTKLGDNWRTVNDLMRQEFLSTSQVIGSVFKTSDKGGIGGAGMKKASDNLLVFGKRYGMSAGEVAEYTYKMQSSTDQFSDGAINRFQKLFAIAKKYAIPSVRTFVTSIADLTNNFRLQNNKTEEATQLYLRYYAATKNAQAATELTQKTVGAFANLPINKIAAFLVLSGKGKPGMGLLTQAYEFAAGEKGSAFGGDRFKLIQAGIVRAISPAIRKGPDGLGIMSSYISKQLNVAPEVAEKISKAISLSDDNTKISSNELKAAVDEANTSLEGTVGADEQILNLLNNSLNTLIRSVLNIESVTTQSNEPRELSDLYGKMASDQATANKAKSDKNQARYNEFTTKVGNDQTAIQNYLTSTHTSNKKSNMAVDAADMAGKQNLVSLTQQGLKVGRVAGELITPPVQRVLIDLAPTANWLLKAVEDLTGKHAPPSQRSAEGAPRG